MSEADFRRYAAHLAHEPPLGDRLDWWMSQVLAVLINTNRRSGAAAVDPEDLIPERWVDNSVRSRREKFKDALRGLAMTQGKVVE